MFVRSFVTHPREGERVAHGAVVKVEGLALDGGSGIASVELSTDGGVSWKKAKLEAPMGKYAWRRWRATWTPQKPGTHTLAVRAKSASGEVQPETAAWNRSGYARNVIERYPIEVA